MNIKTVKIIGLITLVILTITLSVIRAEYSQENERVQSEISEVDVPEKKTFVKQPTHDDVKHYETVVKDTLDSFLSQHHSDYDVTDYSKDGIKDLTELFRHGATYDVNEQSELKKVIKFYSHFNYEIDDISVMYTNEGRHVYFRPTIKFDDEVTNEHVRVVELIYNKNDKLIGGQLYGTTR